MAKEYGTYPENILRAHSKRREARQVLIELSYQINFRKKSLMQLGEELGGVGGDSIAHTHKRIQKKMKEDKKLSRRVNRIYQELIRQELYSGDWSDLDCFRAYLSRIDGLLPKSS